MKIKEYLKAQNISVAQLSKDTQIPYTTVSELVNGKVDIDRVYVATALKLAEVCQLPFETFYNLCKETTNVIKDPEAHITIKNKHYYVDYCIDGINGSNLLFKVNNINSKFVEDAAKWEIKSIKEQLNQHKATKEVEEWMPQDTI